MKKKGQITNQVASLIPAAMMVVILIVGIVLGAKMVQTVRDDQTADSAARNISDSGLSAFNTFGDYFDIIVLAIIITVIVGLLLGTFIYFKAR